MWKSDNQGVKEETFIQTDLVGGVEMGSWGGEDMWQGGSWRTGEGEALAGGLGSCTFSCG